MFSLGDIPKFRLCFVVYRLKSVVWKKKKTMFTVCIAISYYMRAVASADIRRLSNCHVVLNKAFN